MEEPSLRFKLFTETFELFEIPVFRPQFQGGQIPYTATATATATGGGGAVAVAVAVATGLRRYDIVSLGALNTLLFGYHKSCFFDLSTNILLPRYPYQDPQNPGSTVLVPGVYHKLGSSKLAPPCATCLAAWIHPFVTHRDTYNCEIQSNVGKMDGKLTMR